MADPILGFFTHKKTEEKEKEFEDFYLLSRQVAGEYHGPAFQAYKQKAIEQQQEFIQEMKSRGKTDEEIRDMLYGVQEPAIDPVSAFSGGFVGGAKSAIQAGTKITSPIKLD